MVKQRGAEPDNASDTNQVLMSRKSPTISAVIIARNQEATIQRCLSSVIAQSVPIDEVIVVVGRSRDRTYRYALDMATRYDEMEVLSEDVSLTDQGAAAARNLGAETATGELLLFVNGDVTIGPDYVSDLLILMRGERLDAVSGLRWNVRNSAVSGLMNVHYALNYRLLPKVSTSPPFLRSDALLVKAESFWDAGGFDSDMSASEDADLGFRLRGNGNRLGYDKEATIWHEGRRYGSIADWFQQLRGYGRGAAALARSHSWRLESERSGFHQNVVRPISFFLTFLLAFVVTANIFWLLGLAVLGAGLSGAGLKYTRTVSKIYRDCGSVELPTELMPQDVVIYPLFRAVRAAALSMFTRYELMSSIVRKTEHRTEDSSA